MAAREHESDSDAESMERCEWLLGFVEQPRKRTDLLRHRFPSKLGGRPAWLDPLHLPTEEQLTCRVTGKPLDFLLQVRRLGAAAAAATAYAHAPGRRHTRLAGQSHCR
jgi:hypothetical protein